MFTNIVKVSHCHKLEIACCFAVHLPYRYVLRKGSSSMMRLSSTEGTDGFEETPGHRVRHWKATMCKGRLLHRNKGGWGG